jgi:hypothetical protein
MQMLLQQNAVSQTRQMNCDPLSWIESQFSFTFAAVPCFFSDDEKYEYIFSVLKV